MTTALVLISAFFGALLGLRFRVFVLIPATALIWLAVSTIEWAVGESAGRIVCMAILSAISLQISYIGQVVRSVAAGNRGTRCSSNLPSFL